MILPYAEEYAYLWDNFLLDINQGPFIQSRNYLAYHKDRFRDASLILKDGKGSIRAIFPAAQDISDPLTVISHPGLTYGGLLFNPGCQPDEIVGMLEEIILWFKRSGYERLIYKSTPNHVRFNNTGLELYAVWRSGGRLYRRDLWNVIELTNKRIKSEDHVRRYKKAIKFGLKAEILGIEEYQCFYSMLKEALFNQHGVSPAHELDELIELQLRVPQKIELWGARGVNGNLLACVWMFKLHDRCWHTQYITSNLEGREMAATNFLLESLIMRAELEGVLNFSFGSSTEQAGLTVNSGLYRFKNALGWGSSVQDHYEFVING